MFDENNHLIFLDAFAENGALRSCYGEKYAEVAALRNQIDKMQMDEGEKLRRMEMLRHQITEIEKAELTVGEDDALMERRRVLQNAEKLSDGIHMACACLYGDEDSDGAAALLSQAERELARLSRFTESYEPLRQQLSDLMYQVQDAAEEAYTVEYRLEK